MRIPKEKLDFKNSEEKMKKFLRNKFIGKQILILFFILIFLPLMSSEIKIISETKDEIVLQFELCEYQISQKTLKGRSFNEIKMDNAAFPTEKGEPNIPYICRSIIIPENSETKLQITDVISKEIDIETIIPSFGSVSRYQSSPEFDFALSAVYEEDIWINEDLAECGEQYILRDFCGKVIRFNPFSYNPFQKKLRIVESFTVTVRKESVIDFPHRISTSFTNIYENHFLNYNLLSNRYPPITDTGDMIIISTTEFSEPLMPLLEWKNRKGIRTEFYLFPDDTGNTWESIKDFIQNLYDTEELTFILLVGDADDIPPAIGCSGWSSGHEADPVYTLLAGEDEYPDALIGRFSVETLQEAETVINKNIFYETEPDPEADWFDKALGIASDVAFPPYPPDWELMEGLREIMLDYNYSEFTQVYDPGATTEAVTIAVNDGRSWINYLGHGSPTGWNTSDFHNSDVYNLQNTNKLPVIVSVACNTGKFAEYTCLAEAWQRHGTITDSKGSIAFMGASVGQGNPAWIGMEEMINLLVEETYFSIGGLFFNAEMRAIDEHPGLGVGSGSECFQSWHLFGDPSLLYFSDIPESLLVDYETNVSPDITSLPVTVFSIGPDSVPIQNALISIYTNGIIYGSDFTDENGFAEIEITEEFQINESYEINVTAYNKIPYSGIINCVEVLNPPENITIYIESDIVNIEWDEVEGATSYKIFSSDDPNESSENWTLEADGISNTYWSETINGDLKFYYVVASTETPRCKISEF